MIYLLLLNFWIMMIINLSLKMFSKFYFFSNMFFLIQMSWLGILMVFSFNSNSMYLFNILMIYSYVSIFVLFNGYGISLGMIIVAMIKVIAEVSLFILWGIGIMVLDGEDLFYSLNFIMDLSFLFNCLFCFFMLVFLLSGLIGFWLYWAMDASYFISTYLHSCGYVIIGVLLFSNFLIYGMLDIYFWLYNLILFLSIFSFLYFLCLSVFSQDVKKTLGFYSMSSISFLFMIGIQYTEGFPFYFFLSSMMKLFSFLILQHISFFMNSFKIKMDLMMMLFLIVFSVFEFLSIGFYTLSECVGFILVFMEFMKIYCLFILFMKSMFMNFYFLSFKMEMIFISFLLLFFNLLVNFNYFIYFHLLCFLFFLMDMIFDINNIISYLMVDLLIISMYELANLYFVVKMKLLECMNYILCYLKFCNLLDKKVNKMNLNFTLVLFYVMLFFMMIFIYF